MENTTPASGGLSADDLAALKSQKATWQTDGLGLRGQVEVLHNTKAKLDWPDVPVGRRAPVDLES
jgi:hypothetical protein